MNGFYDQVIAVLKQHGFSLSRQKGLMQFCIEPKHWCKESMDSARIKFFNE
jgi:hypothetical protein